MNRNKTIAQYSSNFLFIFLSFILLIHNSSTIQITCGKSFLPCKQHLASSLNGGKFSSLSSASSDFSRGLAPLYAAARLHGLKNTFTAAGTQPLKDRSDLTFNKLQPHLFLITNQTLRDAVVETEREVQVIYSESNAKPMDPSIIFCL